MSGAEVPTRARLAIGIGSIAYGIKDNGFSVFLLVFYNQVLGLPADQVGLVLLCALIIDGLIDPVIGVLSDSTRSRIGRRHPWLYGSALPIGLSWLLLWNPPALSAETMVLHLFAVAVLVRASVSANEVPAAALVPEMTRDYHERTAVIRYRFLFGWGAGLAMLMLAYGVLLTPGPGGGFTAGGFALFGAVGAAAMAMSVLVSALGTHRAYARMPANAAPRHSLGGELRGIAHALSNRAFLILMGMGLFAFANQGMMFALTNYLLPYVWQFGRGGLLAYSVCLFIGVVGAFLTVTPLARRLGKKGAGGLLVLLAAAAGTAPYWLRLAGLFPAPGDPALAPLFLLLAIAGTGAGVATMILISSMVADLVEAAEERTGRRDEGLFYAGFFFVQKCTTGLGIFLAGQIVSLSGFPARAGIGQVPDAVLDRLTLGYAGITIVFAVASSLFARAFPIGRAEHEARLAKLAVAAARQTGQHGG
ncbi:sodium:melibiose symporter [Sphingomonas changnyeongensis]|uniref:Sodium:melibiose symporter n=1 Tax=Sphingomonas changnyeongensis TaxID=2698679 RepID=A0A7Z2NVA2_9SPHN|nr:MFS transporter [Sphingomonas changnyeongensis]QHL90197.1 sodium:melibiose symporter [Sphingomonas changnyeongensis]